MSSRLSLRSLEQGEEGGREVLTRQAYARADGKTDVKAVAEVQVKIDFQREMAKERMDEVRVEYRERDIAKRKEYAKMSDALLRDLTDIDDSMVDYINTWR